MSQNPPHPAAFPAPTRVRGFELLRAGEGELRDRDLSEPGPGQVLMRIRMSGVCASELYDWANAPDRFVPVGHEPVGQVLAAGPGAGLSIGQWVTGRVVRAFTTYLVADASDLVVVPAALKPEEVLGEPVGCVVEGIRRSRVPDGASVAVVGTGFMGLVAVQLLAHSLATAVVAIDPRSDARQAAVENGADEALEPDAPNLKDGEFDVVIEATGTQAGLELATRIVRAHGILSVLGYHRTPRTVDMQQWNYKALDVVNAHVQDPRLLREAVKVGLDLQASGRIDPSQLITHRFRETEVNEAFETLRAKPTGFIKAVIDY